MEYNLMMSIALVASTQYDWIYTQIRYFVRVAKLRHFVCSDPLHLGIVAGYGSDIPAGEAPAEKLRMDMCNLTDITTMPSISTMIAVC
jgi:hypothetical protein